MRIALIPIAVLALCGCDSRKAATIPLDQTSAFRDGYIVEVARAGTVDWNGQKLNDAEFMSYMRQIAAIPKGARLWVEFEPGGSSARATAIRQHIIASGLCEQKRCVEGRWRAHRKVVY